MGKVASRFARVEPRRRARAFVLGLLADLPRKNGWTVAEHTDDAGPAGMQHFLSRARWDADEVRDDTRDFVVEHLGDEDAVRVVHETGDLKKGTASVGVRNRRPDRELPGRRIAALATEMIAQALDAGVRARWLLRTTNGFWSRRMPPV